MYHRQCSAAVVAWAGAVVVWAVAVVVAVVVDEERNNNVDAYIRWEQVPDSS